MDVVQTYKKTHTHLLREHVTDLVDGEIVGAVRLQAVGASSEELRQEMRVQRQQSLQTGEESVHDPRLQLNLIQHAPSEHPIHDP